MKVLALVTLPTLGAGNRLRIEQYAPLLRERGIDLQVSSFFDDAAYGVLYRPGHTGAKALSVLRGLARRLRDAWRARTYDLVIVYRESAPLGPPIFERMLVRKRIPYIFDFDDAIFLGPIHPVNRRWAWLRHPSRAVETAKLAAAVIAGNEYLASWARQHNHDVTVIPTPVDTDRHRPLARERKDGAPIIIGWVGSTTTAPYLGILDEPLHILAGRRRDLCLRVIGGEYAHPHMRVELMPYRLDREPADVAGFDIGVLPEPDDPWTRGKGAFKALLYMAAGLPVVASRVGVNPQVVVDGETGFCVDDGVGWAEAIERLADDPELREGLGAQGRVRVVERYSLRVQAPRLAGVLERAARP